MLNGLRQAMEANRADADWKAGLVVLAMLGTLFTVLTALVFYFAA